MRLGSLVSDVRPSLAVSDFGDWLPTETVAPWVGLVFVLACLVALPWGAWTVWHAL